MRFTNPQIDTRFEAVYSAIDPYVKSGVKNDKTL